LAFDRVLVIEDGRVAEDGDPRELASRAGSRYADMLAAEEAVSRSMWQNAQWRRISLLGGQLMETEASE
jgi:ABC-type multidrug transport system ATPase subunit